MKNLLLFYLAGISACFAGDPKFPVSEIPADLLKDVNAVVREDRMVFEIISKSKGKLHVYYAVTILNPNGKSYASTVLDYDNKLSKVTKINANVYDADGRNIKKLKNNEISDQSAYDGSSLFSDNRLKVIDLTNGSYPYTVELEYEKEYNYLLFIDGSTAIPDEKVSVQRFSYQLIFPPSLAPRYKTFNMPSEPEAVKTPAGLQSLTWSLENLKPIKFEPFGPVEAFLPYIRVAPSAFEFDGYGGNMSSWDEFGRWILSLNRGRDVLPEETKTKIQQLTSGATTTEQKVRILYEYLQSKTRYVGVQLGIGGYQPFEASVVDNTGYGDCKALSNYMIAMLQSVGIKSHYALIRAGSDNRPIDVSFPSSQFNHVIVAVPNEKDTLWLECTSQTNPFGYQGKFTGDRKALLITESGAKLVNTTRYPAEVNLQRRTADVYVEPTGDATATVVTTYQGTQYENANLDGVLTAQFDTQKKWVQSNTEIPAFDIKSFSMTNNRDRLPSAVVRLDLNLRKYGSVSGKRIFLMPNLMNRSSYIPEKVESRKSDVVVKSAYTDLDTIRFHIPEALYAEFVPEPVHIKSRFGEYEAKFSVESGQLVYMRRMQVNRGRFAAETYSEMIDFYRNVAKADNTRVVFLNKT